MSEANQPLALDVSLEQARALHRVWRAMNDGDCPKCHKYHQATAMIRHRKLPPQLDKVFVTVEPIIECPSCGFLVTENEIAEIEKMFAPAMDGAVKIFEDWREARKTQHK